MALGLTLGECVVHGSETGAIDLQVVFAMGLLCLSCGGRGGEGREGKGGRGGEGGREGVRGGKGGEGVTDHV